MGVLVKLKEYLWCNLEAAQLRHKYTMQFSFSSVLASRFEMPSTEPCWNIFYMYYSNVH